MVHTGERGGIGIRRRLKIFRLRSCGFESHRSYQSPRVNVFRSQEGEGLAGMAALSVRLFFREREGESSFLRKMQRIVADGHWIGA